MSFWAVVQTETQREHVARLMMMREGYETYLPRIKVRRDRGALLFPSYLFVRIVDRWYPIVWTPGVVRLLMNGNRPAQLRDGVVEAIRRREIGGFVRLPVRTPRIGEKFRITQGPFAGHHGLFDGMTGASRHRVLLGLLGQTVVVELPSHAVEPLDVASNLSLRY